MMDFVFGILGFILWVAFVLGIIGIGIFMFQIVFLIFKNNPSDCDSHTPWWVWWTSRHNHND